MQRALATRTMAESRMVPLLAGFGKIGFSLLVIVPALGASVTGMLGTRTSFDETLPLLMATSYGPILLGLGTTALLASLMSSLGANVTAFSSLWIYEIQPTLFPQIGVHSPNRSSRITLTVGVLLGIASSVIAFQFPSLMEYIQLLFSFFGAPFFAVFLAGVFSHRASAAGALWGLSSGVIAAAIFHALLVARLFTLGSHLTASFYVAILAFSISLTVTSLVKPRVDALPAKFSGLVYEWKFLHAELQGSPTWWFLAASLLAACAALNYVWR
jgi:SSS family solute:Na+ symporter